jgi:hypothetical protein
MSDNKDLPDGFIYKRPHENSPDFHNGKISIKVDEFTQWINDNQEAGWVNLELLTSKGGKFYAKKDVWKPKESQPSNRQVYNDGAQMPPVMPAQDDFQDEVPF